MSHIKGKGHCQSCSIRHVSIFANLSIAQLNDIADFHPTVITFHSGESIYHQDGKSNHAYTLRKGLVKLIKSLPDGRTQIMRVLQGGDLFGFDGFAHSNYNQSAIALSDCEVCRLPLDGLQALRESRPEIDHAMLNRWLTHLRCAEDMMLELGSKKAAERLANFLINWCKNNQNWHRMPLTRGELGELLGLTIETVSRLFSQWKKQGLIEEIRGKVRIPNQQALLNYVTP